MTPHEQGLLQAILAAPGEDAPRLIYADWCEENGDPERAEFIRVHCEIAARFGVPIDGSPVATGDRAADQDEIRLRRRERELKDANYGRWLVPVEGVVCNLHRGFVNRINCKPEVFLRHGVVLLGQYPIEKVGLRWPKIVDSCVHIEMYLDNSNQHKYQTWDVRWYIVHPITREQTKYLSKFAVSEYERHHNPRWLDVQMLRLRSALLQAVNEGHLPEYPPEFESSETLRRRAEAKYEFQQQFPFLPQ